MEAVEEQALVQRLQVAIEQNQFRVHYQPQIDRRTRQIVGAEALLRWQDPYRGMVTPGNFLSTLESTGLIVTVGEWALRQVTEDCQRWRRLGFPRLRIGVNLSPLQLEKRAAAACVFETSALRACCDLQFEVVASLMADAPQPVLRALQALRFEGVDVTLQEFGGNSSVRSRLWALPVDGLKIDRALIHRMTFDREAEIAVSSVIALARAFRLSLVAEGVETQAQLGLLEELGCPHTQGLLYSAPVPAMQFESLLNAMVCPPKRAGDRLIN